MKLRLMQIILFFPCCIIDSLSLFIIHIPLYITCGIKPNEKEPLLQWLFELKNE
jgi:hypothetical protein